MAELEQAAGAPLHRLASGTGSGTGSDIGPDIGPEISPEIGGRRVLRAPAGTGTATTAAASTAAAGTTPGALDAPCVQRLQPFAPGPRPCASKPAAPCNQACSPTCPRPAAPRTPGVRSMRTGVEPIRWRHRPLLFYALSQACNRTRRRLQPYVREAAALRAGGCNLFASGCNPSRQWLQPYLLVAATLFACRRRVPVPRFYRATSCARAATRGGERAS